MENNNELIEKIEEWYELNKKENTEHWHQSYHWNYITEDQLLDYLETLKTEE